MASNTSFIPSAKDLALVLPRLAHSAGAFALQLPDQVDSIFSKIRNGGSMIADATSANMSGPKATTTSATLFVQNTALPEAVAVTNGTGLFSWFTSSIQFDGFRGFGGMFSYFGSRWAIATFGVSIFLNRTHFYASSRQNLIFRWRTRLLLYAVPICLLLVQTLWVLQAMKCQTSLDFPIYRYGDSRKKLAIDFSAEGGFMHSLSSILLFWEDDAAACSAMSMSAGDDKKLYYLGSFSLVWPFFITICVSQFAETLSCALQGRQPMQETGMTTFEHSLAFAECEAMISNAYGLGVFGLGKSDKDQDSSTRAGTTGEYVLLTRSMVLRRLNVPSDVLLIAFISCLSHLSSAILAVTGQRHRYRLVNTGIWALCYLTAFVWSIIRIMASPLNGDELGVLRFPTVCIIGFVPHILILAGISVCAIIYGLALLITMVSLPPDAPANMSIRQRFHVALDNLQANVQFSSSSSIRLNWNEDFYTNLLKVGFNMLTAASEAVYLNEGSRIKIHDMTWLERKRLSELVKSRNHRAIPAIPEELQGQEIARGLEYADTNTTGLQSGYAKERKSKSKRRDGMSGHSNSDSGLGLTERRSRWELVMEFLHGVLLLVVRVFARTVGTVLTKAGFQRLSALLQRYTGDHDDPTIRKSIHRARSSGVRDFWATGPESDSTMPKDTGVDVEHEMRQRLSTFPGGATDELLDANLYEWWRVGGYWGETDMSGDFAPESAEEEDLTSVISASDATSITSMDEWESDGQATPTERDPYPGLGPTPPRQGPDAGELARLLDPKSPEEREEARVLSQHLRSERPLTRSQYRLRLNQEKARLLALPGQAPMASISRQQADMDEEQALERFILDRREQAATSSARGQSWLSGAAGMGAGGPQCVVCQSNPRAILVWPCGCLSICDECRVGVAARNFSSCLCCRTNVVAYSKLYVP